MAMRKRKVGSYATELVKKAREAMLTALQINPQIDFKSELFIITSVSTPLGMGLATCLRLQ